MVYCIFYCYLNIWRMRQCNLFFQAFVLEVLSHNVITKPTHADTLFMSAHTNLISLLTINRLISDKNLIRLQSDVMIPVLCFSVLCSRQGWTGNLAYRAGIFPVGRPGGYMFFLNIYIYIYIYSSKQERSQK